MLLWGVSDCRGQCYAEGPPLGQHSSCAKLHAHKHCGQRMDGFSISERHRMLVETQETGLADRCAEEIDTKRFAGSGCFWSSRLAFRPTRWFLEKTPQKHGAGARHCPCRSRAPRRVGVGVRATVRVRDRVRVSWPMWNVEMDHTRPEQLFSPTVPAHSGSRKTDHTLPQQYFSCSLVLRVFLVLGVLCCSYYQYSQRLGFSAAYTSCTLSP